MEDVKRYDLRQEGEYSQREGVMTEVSNGDWVRANDYDSISDELGRLKIVVADALYDLKRVTSELEEG